MLRFLGATEAQTRVVIERFRPLENSEFEVRCPSASPDVLACMETADNAYSGVARCGLLRGRPLTQRLILRPLIGATPWGAAEREVSDSAGAAALRSALIGSWDRQGRDAWTFTAAGEARQSFAQTPGAPGERFTTTSASRFFMTPSRGFFSAVVQGETLYLTLAEDGIAQPIPASGPIVLTERGFWLVEDLRTRPRCTGFNMYGQPVESARCAWEGQGDARRLLMMVGFGHDIAMGEAVGEVPLRFREMSGHLVPADNGARFYRRVESTTPAPAR